MCDDISAVPPHVEKGRLWGVGSIMGTSTRRSVRVRSVLAAKLCNFLTVTSASGVRSTREIEAFRNISTVKTTVFDSTEAEKDTVLRFALRACVLRFEFRFAFCACVLRFAFRSALEFCVSHFALRFPVVFCCRSDLILLFSSLNTLRSAEKSKLSQHSGQLMCENIATNAASPRNSENRLGSL